MDAINRDLEKENINFFSGKEKSGVNDNTENHKRYDNKSDNESNKGDKINIRKKYFVRLIYDALLGSDDSNESRELAIDTFTNALEKFVKDVLIEERNEMILEVRKDVRNEIMKHIEDIKSNIGMNHSVKILNDSSFAMDVLQNIKETKNLTQGSQAINRDTNEKSEMIIERLEKFENVLGKRIKNIEDIIEHSKRAENLTTTDKQILNFIKEKGIVCADDVQNVFKYKGKNAASARLNILYRKNELEKIIRDKKVYYQIPNDKIKK